MTSAFQKDNHRTSTERNELLPCRSLAAQVGNGRSTLVLWSSPTVDADGLYINLYIRIYNIYVPYMYVYIYNICYIYIYTLCGKYISLEDPECLGNPQRWTQRYHCAPQLPTVILAQVLTVRNLVGEVVTIAELQHEYLSMERCPKLALDSWCFELSICSIRDHSRFVQRMVVGACVFGVWFYKQICSSGFLPAFLLLVTSKKGKSS